MGRDGRWWFCAEINVLKRILIRNNGNGLLPEGPLDLHGLHWNTLQHTKVAVLKWKGFRKTSPGTRMPSPRYD